MIIWLLFARVFCGEPRGLFHLPASICRRHFGDVGRMSGERSELHHRLHGEPGEVRGSVRLSCAVQAGLFSWHSLTSVCFPLARQNEEPPFESEAGRGLGGGDASHGASRSGCRSANRVPAREGLLLLQTCSSPSWSPHDCVCGHWVHRWSSYIPCVKLISFEHF